MTCDMCHPDLAARQQADWQHRQQASPVHVFSTGCMLPVTSLPLLPVERPHAACHVPAFAAFEQPFSLRLRQAAH